MTETITKHKPSDEELNRAAATVCGWRDVVRFGDNRGKRGIKSGTWMGIPANEIYKSRRRIPDFCNDRNALPELLQRVVNENREYEFESAMRGDTDALNAYLLPCRTIVAAALVALHAWPEEWSEE